MSLYIDTLHASVEAGMSTSNLLRRFKKDKVPIFKIRRKFFLLQDVFDKWLKERR